MQRSAAAERWRVSVAADRVTRGVLGIRRGLAVMSWIGCDADEAGAVCLRDPNLVSRAEEE